MPRPVAFAGGGGVAVVAHPPEIVPLLPTVPLKLVGPLTTIADVTPTLVCGNGPV